MIYLFPLILIPLIVGGCAFYFLQTTITWKEFLLQQGISLSLVVGGFYLAKYQALQSTEYLNGHITEKTKDITGCCHCRQVCMMRDRKGNCSAYKTVCDHLNDYSWGLDTSIENGWHITLDSCDGYGIPPKSWVNAKVGEFATVSQTYQNYIKADPESLIRHRSKENLLNKIPDFPSIHDHYKIKKVIKDNDYSGEIPTGWQFQLENLNDSLGNNKEIDVVFLLTSNKNADDYANALESKWLYGPKNALTVIIGTDGGTIKWARAVTLSRVETLKIEIREQLTGKSLNDEQIIPTVGNLINQLWKRTPMDEWEYLASHAKPSTGGLVFLYFISISLSIGLTILMHQKDIFGDFPDFPCGRHLRRFE